MRQTTTAPRPRTKKSAGGTVSLFSQANATAVWRVLDRLTPIPQIKIAEAVGISQSAVSEWRNERRDVTFERIPALAELYGVDPLLFLSPAADIEKALAPHMKAVEDFQRAEMERVRETLRTMRQYRESAVQSRMFEVDSVKQSRRRGNLVPVD